MNRYAALDWANAVLLTTDTQRDLRGWRGSSGNVAGW